jgi:hypothetical protein
MRRPECRCGEAGQLRRTCPWTTNTGAEQRAICGGGTTPSSSADLTSSVTESTSTMVG